MKVIKLGGKGIDDNKAQREAFMDDFWNQTTAHPFDDRSRIFQNKATLEVWPCGSKIHISDIMSLAPKSGAGTEALTFLKGLADKHGVSLEGTAKAYHNDKAKITSTKRLVKWYEKHGFQIGDGDDDEGYDIHYIGFGRFTQGDDPHVAFVKKDGKMQKFTPKNPIKEDAPTMCAGSGAIAGIGIGPQGEPGRKRDKKRKDIILGTLDRKKP